MQIYQRKEILEDRGKANEYKSKIEIQKGVIEKCITAGLNFSTVTGDVWYFTKDIVTFLNSKGISWVFQSKGNRRIKVKGRWTTLDSLQLYIHDSNIVNISGNVYNIWEVEGEIKGVGYIKVVISEGKNGKRYYVTNKVEWGMIKILETYQRRWNVEVIHRDLKQDGIGRIYLRGLCKTELYLRLIVTGRVLLEISSIRSLHKYQSI
ncbi:MAG: transposase, partial [Thermoplasmata archaeon]